MHTMNNKRVQQFGRNQQQQQPHHQQQMQQHHQQNQQQQQFQSMQSPQQQVITLQQLQNAPGTQNIAQERLFVTPHMQAQGMPQDLAHFERNAIFADHYIDGDSPLEPNDSINYNPANYSFLDQRYHPPHPNYVSFRLSSI